MKLLIELPTWLGDTVMATPAIENLVNHFNDVEITLIGSIVAIEALKHHPKVIKTYILDKQFSNLYKTLKSLNKFDIFFTFRGSLRAKIIKLFISAERKYQFDKNKYVRGHQVEKYNNFVNDALNINELARSLILHNVGQSNLKKNKLLGINPGATYGSAKRWNPKKFADVAKDLSNQYDIIIFGGPQERNIAKDIEKYLIKKGVDNYLNLAASLTIRELISQIANLDLFITGDSGPMHLASVFKIPTVAIFGPTEDKETSQWMNTKSVIVKKNLDCQPCMQKTCPLKHHNCMKYIDVPDVLAAVKSLN